MINKNIVLAIVVVIAVVGIGAYLVRPQNTQGKVVFGITDAALNMGDVSSVLITINKVEMHSVVNGWVIVSNETKQYDLLVLKQSGAVSLLASANIDAGTYDQVRLIVSKVVIVKNGVPQEAKLPSGELKIVGNIIVNADKTSSMVFDFLADKSLHMTGNGKFIFAPVVKITKRSDVSVELKSNDEVNITGDKENEDEDVGMDEKGEIRNNFELKGNFELDNEDNILGSDKNEDNNEDSNKNNTETKN